MYALCYIKINGFVCGWGNIIEYSGYVRQYLHNYALLSNDVVGTLL